jgi:hypothetical protein
MSDYSSADQEITVTVSITLSKSMTVIVDEDTTNCNLEEAIEQHYLPQEAYRYIDYEDIKADLKDWVVDELVVIPE